MLAAVTGTIHGNTVIIDDEEIQKYDGAKVIVTLPEYPSQLRSSMKKKAKIDWDSFIVPSERGQHVDEYMKEMRDGDRVIS